MPPADNGRFPTGPFGSPLTTFGSPLATFGSPLTTFGPSPTPFVSRFRVDRDGRRSPLRTSI